MPKDSEPLTVYCIFKVTVASGILAIGLRFIQMSSKNSYLGKLFFISIYLVLKNTYVTFYLNYLNYHWHFA